MIIPTKVMTSTWSCISCISPHQISEVRDYETNQAYCGPTIFPQAALPSVGFETAGDTGKSSFGSDCASFLTIPIMGCTAGHTPSVSPTMVHTPTIVSGMTGSGLLSKRKPWGARTASVGERGLKARLQHSREFATGVVTMLKRRESGTP